MISTSGNLLTSCGDLKSSQLNSILILYIGLLDLVGALVKLCCVSSKYLIFINLALLAWQCFVFGFISGFCPYKNEFLACSNLLLLCKKGPFHTRRFCSKYFPQPFETHAHWVWYFSFVARFFSTAHIEDLVVYWDNLTIFLCFAHPFCLIRGKKVEVFFLERKTKWREGGAGPAPRAGGRRRRSRRRAEARGAGPAPCVILFEWEK